MRTPQGLPVQIEGITIEIRKIGNWHQAECVITATKGVADDYGFLMCATEFLLGVAARESDVGFEKALELLTEGAIASWKRKKLADLEELDDATTD